MKTLSVYIILLVAGCAGGNADFADNGNYEASQTEPMYDKAEESSSSKSSKNKQEIIHKKKIIKTGNISYQVDDLDKEYAYIKQVTDQFKAYIFSENQNNSSDRKSYSITLKIPPQNFDNLIAEISKGKKVDYKNINLSDVTEQFYDLTTRIANKKQLENRYNELLKKAKNINEILDIESRLNNVRGDIENMQGRLKRLNYEINFSTLQLNFYEILPYKIVDDQRPGFFARLANSFSSGWNIFVSFILVIIRLWPFAILAGLVIFFIKKVRKK